VWLALADLSLDLLALIERLTPREREALLSQDGDGATRKRGQWP